MDIENAVKYLPGIGPKRAEILAQDIGVSTINELLYYFPFKHVDRSKYYKINELNSDLPYVQVVGQITGFNILGEGAKKRLIGIFVDETGSIELVWFKNHKWIQQTYKNDTLYIIYGKPVFFNGRYSIVHPEIDVFDKTEQTLKTSLQPHYITSERMKKNLLTSRVIHRLIGYCIDKYLHELEESMPNYLIEQLHLLPLQEAIYHIHYPASTEMLKKAEYRLKFEELFRIQLELLYQKVIRKKILSKYVCKSVGTLFNTFYYTNLPFKLTEAQKRVIKEIRRDLGSGKQMNRLLQGDVGSGKTLVALMVMIIAIDNGLQTCLMAPTEILANQHYENFIRFLNGLPINIALLTGSTSRRKRNEIFEQLEKGLIHILIGTHALIEDSVKFRNLGLVIIDEQHRFGVAQRARLWKKNEHPPTCFGYDSYSYTSNISNDIIWRFRSFGNRRIAPGAKTNFYKTFY